MDALSKTVDSYLRLLSRTVLMATPSDRSNIDILLTMLGPADKEIMEAYYGIGGKDAVSASEIAAHFGVQPEQIEEIVVKDLRHIAVTPEWQMMLQQFPETVRRRILPKNAAGSHTK